VVTDWNTLPPVLILKEVAPLLRRSIGTIHRHCAAKRMQPPPMSYAAGRYTWSRDVVRAYVERGLSDQPMPRRPVLTVPPAVRVAARADVKATAAALLRGV
jgi:hypothetical protein